MTDQPDLPPEELRIRPRQHDDGGSSYIAERERAAAEIIYEKRRRPQVRAGRARPLAKWLA